MTGRLSDKFKLSTTIPIRKVSRTNKCEEFRPINMLPTIKNIIEKMVYKQLLGHVEKKNILITEQSGFRSKHSCETALQYVINH